jgi:hypothetical protein
MLLTIPPYLLSDEEMVALYDLACQACAYPGAVADALGGPVALYVAQWGADLRAAYEGEAASEVSALALPRRVAELSAAELAGLHRLPGRRNVTVLRTACVRLLAEVAPLPVRPALTAAK